MLITTKNIKEITIILTKECNLNCKYCSQKHIKDKPTNEYIQKIINNFNKLKKFLNEFVYIDIFGGEPLLYQDQISILIDFLRNQEILLNKKFKIRIFTNGLIKIKDIMFYKKNNVFFSISYDGLKNHARGKSNDILFYNIQKLLDLDLIDKISFSVLNPKKDFLLKNYYYIANRIKNFSKVTHYLIREPFLWTEEGINSYLENFNKFIQFSKLYKEKYNSFPLYIKNKISFFNKNIQGCGAGINRFTISNEILDCGIINFKNEFFIKNKNYLYLFEKYCNTCEVKNDCDKKCLKYFFDYPELFIKYFCKIKKFEIKKIKEIL